MAGNSQRKGAIKKTGKGNPTAGSGGRRRQGLEGKGPTPRAEDRPNHKIYKMKNATQKREAARPKRKQGDAAEWVAGRNPVVELLRATVPIHALYVAEGTERDDRIREIFKLAAEQHISLLEIGRIELDKLTGGAVHQGIAAKLNAYEYADPAVFARNAAELGEPALEPGPGGVQSLPDGIWLDGTAVGQGDLEAIGTRILGLEAAQRPLDAVFSAAAPAEL